MIAIKGSDQIRREPPEPPQKLHPSILHLAAAIAASNIIQLGNMIYICGGTEIVLLDKIQMIAFGLISVESIWAIVNTCLLLTGQALDPDSTKQELRGLIAKIAKSKGVNEIRELRLKTKKLNKKLKRYNSIGQFVKLAEKDMLQKSKNLSIKHSYNEIRNLAGTFIALIIFCTGTCQFALPLSSESSIKILTSNNLHNSLIMSVFGLVGYQILVQVTHNFVTKNFYKELGYLMRIKPPNAS